MRMYSADELDVMAEAYFKALDKLPVDRRPSSSRNGS